MLATGYADVNSWRSVFAWDDLPIFVALYRERTTGRAARALGVSQPTVVRRMAAFEHAIGLTLFERTPSGLVPTPAADQLAQHAGRVERAVCEFAAEAGSLAGSGLNVIRLTFLDHFERLLVPVLREFRRRWPAIQTELLASDQVYDLARGEADIAIRGREAPVSDEIVVHDLPPCGWTVFASAHGDLADRPHSAEEVSSFPIALLDSSAGRLPVYQWLKAQAGERTTPMRCSNYSALKSAIASGAAVSALPCTVGIGDRDLVPCFPPMEEFDVPIYLVARRAILRRPPARDLFDSIALHFEMHPTLLTGQRG
jgi:DNA-binding transcriptional LysR family regulator